MLRLGLLIFVSLIAFAGNSILNRAALQPGHVDPATFAGVRLISGITCLWLLLAWRRGMWRPTPNASGSLSLFTYAIAFSYAYLVLDAGAGALVLFGVVQITLFGWAVWSGERVPPLHYLGAILAFVGLLVLFWPQPGASFSIIGFLLMVVAGVAWGVYTALGRGAGDPTRRTADNFAGAAILSIPLIAVLGGAIDGPGIALAIASGAITSGLGYALWYSVLPKISSSLAAILQLTVPIIAAVGGIMFLGEALTVPFIAAAVLVLGGTFVALRA